MVFSSISRLATTSIEGVHPVEQFADRLLYPLHTLLQQFSPSRQTHFKMEDMKVSPLARFSENRSLVVRILIVFLASIGTLLLTLPALLIKSVTQYTQASSEKHTALAHYLRRWAVFPLHTFITQETFVALATKEAQRLLDELLSRPKVTFPMYACVELQLDASTEESKDPKKLAMYRSRNEDMIHNNPRKHFNNREELVAMLEWFVNTDCSIEIRRKWEEAPFQIHNITFSISVCSKAQSPEQGHHVEETTQSSEAYLTTEEQSARSWHIQSPNDVLPYTSSDVEVPDDRASQQKKKWVENLDLTKRVKQDNRYTSVPDLP